MPRKRTAAALTTYWHRWPSVIARVAVVVYYVLLALTAAPAEASRSTVPPLPSPMPTITHNACPVGVDTGGCFDPATFTVYVDEHTSRFTRLHELGHAFDAQRLDAGERSRFTRLSRDGAVAHASWLATAAMVVYDGETEYAGEDFADTYAACRMRVREVDRGLCRFIRRAAR